MIDQTVKLMRYGEYRILAIPAVHTFTTVSQRPGGELAVTGTATKRTSSYLVYKQGAKTVLYYDSLRATSPSKQEVNELINNYTFNTFPFYTPDDDVLVHTRKNSATHEVIETHTYRHKADDTYFDTIYYHFSRQHRRLPYAITPVLDSLRRMKMYKAVYHYNPVVDKKTGRLVPARNYIFTIEEDTATDRTAMALFITGAIRQLHNGIL